MNKPTAPLTIGPVVQDEWSEARSMARTVEYDQSVTPDRVCPNPYAKFLTSRKADLTLDELDEVIADCDWYSNPDGPGAGDDALRAAYRRVLVKAKAARRVIRQGEIDYQNEGVDPESAFYLR